MNRVHNYRRSLAAVLAVVLFSCVLQASPNPNIVLILADDMGIGDISAFNAGSKIRTVNLDEMSANGIRFTDAHSVSSVDTPSRYGLLTGRYAFRTKLKNGLFDGLSGPLIDSNRSTLATMLGREGYNTACIGTWNLGWNWVYDHGDGGRITYNNIDYSKPITEGPTTRGFDYFYGIPASLDTPPYVYVENDMPTAVPDRELEGQEGVMMQRKGPAGAGFNTDSVLIDLRDRALNYIGAQKDSDRPFFLYMPLTAPHLPIVPAKEYRGKSGLSAYGDFVLMTDDVVGDIIAKLKETGLYQNTIVVFASDNGCSSYAGMADMEKKGHRPNHIYRGAKSDLFDGGHRVPLIISWGNRYDGQKESGLVSLADLYATFAEMAGYALPDDEAEDSYSIWPVLTGQGKSNRTEMVHHSADGSFALRSGRWKLFFCPGSGGWGYPPTDAPGIAELPAVQLYDMENDPGEKTNLQSEYPEIVARLKARMRKYIEDGRSTPGEKQPDDATGSEWKQVEPFMR